MSLFAIVLILIVIGVVLWLIETKIPMDATIKKIIIAFVIIVVIVWLLRETGAWNYLVNTHLDWRKH